MPGRTKTRLAGRPGLPGLGPIRAARVYRVLVAQTLRAVGRDPRWRVWIAIAPARAWSPSRVWPLARFAQVIPQESGDLGRRMARALRSRPPGDAVLIGSDIVDIRSDDIALAFGLLSTNGFVFGPSVDGGFWLVGARRRPVFRSPFAGVTWSQPTTLSETLARIDAQAGVALVGHKRDIDTVEDWNAWREEAARRQPCRRPDAV